MNSIFKDPEKMGHVVTFVVNSARRRSAEAPKRTFDDFYVLLKSLLGKENLPDQDEIRAMLAGCSWYNGDTDTMDLEINPEAIAPREDLLLACLKYETGNAPVVRRLRSRLNDITLQFKVKEYLDRKIPGRTDEYRKMLAAEVVNTKDAFDIFFSHWCATPDSNEIVKELVKMGAAIRSSVARTYEAYRTFCRLHNRVACSQHVFNSLMLDKRIRKGKGYIDGRGGYPFFYNLYVPGMLDEMEFRLTQEIDACVILYKGVFVDANGDVVLVKDDVETLTPVIMPKRKYEKHSTYWEDPRAARKKRYGDDERTSDENEDEQEQELPEVLVPELPDELLLVSDTDDVAAECIRVGASILQEDVEDSEEDQEPEGEKIYPDSPENEERIIQHMMKYKHATRSMAEMVIKTLKNVNGYYMPVVDELDRE